MRYIVALMGAALAALLFMAPTSASAGHATIRNLPRVVPAHSLQAARNAGWQSENWSGYAITGSTYTSVTGTWTVPTVQPSSSDAYSSSWVGIDGYNDGDLIQTGTEQDSIGGQAEYQAWWEILPAAETPISSITVSPGDTIRASITQGTGGEWTISIEDLTSGQTFSTQQSYSGPLSSAEWIEEAPQVNGSIAPMANYGESSFVPETVNSGSPGFTSSDAGVLVQNGVQVSTPSDPNAETNGFNVAYGATPPSPPA
ncbi:MAG TPA: G1 family glutamic endopeptidase [Candidatus Dormibacteraeota bacterium]|nr:G1 family glutamic endopeptidase [Candidatus Dormibacteraeota bacterium]